MFHNCYHATFAQCFQLLYLLCCPEGTYQCHFGEFCALISKLTRNSKTTDIKDKQTEMWDSGTLLQIIWATFGPVMSNVIWGNFDFQWKGHTGFF